MVNYLIAAALVVTPLGATQVPNPTKEVKTPQKEAEVPYTASEKPPNPTPEDYYVPWDNWLQKQGSPLRGEDFFSAQQETGIKGEVLICITGAETNFGKVAQRGSTTNVGSVGSYDATNTTHAAATPLDGIKMIGHTLNNKLLGHKTTIAQLSRKSEPYGSVYAESTYNWETNVVSCLSKITGKPIDNQYEFRVK